MASATFIGQPWANFFLELENLVEPRLTLICMGGFAMNHLYGSPRQTADIDCCEFHPKSESSALLKAAGPGSVLHKKHGVYLELVRVATVPCDYEERLLEIPTQLQKIRLLGLDPYDLALSKLERSQERDLADISHLARNGEIIGAALEERYEQFHRPYLVGDLNRIDFMFKLWLNMCWPDTYPVP